LSQKRFLPRTNSRNSLCRVHEGGLRRECRQDYQTCIRIFPSLVCQAGESWMSARGFDGKGLVSVGGRDAEGNDRRVLIEEGVKKPRELEVTIMGNYSILCIPALSVRLTITGSGMITRPNTIRGRTTPSPPKFLRKSRTRSLPMSYRRIAFLTALDTVTSISLWIGRLNKSFSTRRAAALGSPPNQYILN
jgi:hypothetical protein